MDIIVDDNEKFLFQWLIFDWKLIEKDCCRTFLKMTVYSILINCLRKIISHFISLYALCAGQYINLICSARELICIKLSLILIFVSLW